jgi:hypothetical protein
MVFSLESVKYKGRERGSGRKLKQRVQEREEMDQRKERKAERW